MALLKGQNIRVVKFSDMQDAARLDAEYAAHPLSEWLDGIVDRPSVTTLDAITTHVSSGHTPYLHDVDIGDIGFVTVECVGPLRFHAEKLKRVTTEQYEHEFTRRPITVGSVSCTIKRRICQAYPWLEEPDAPLAFNQDIALLTPSEGINPAYLAAYLSSQIGQSFADRQKTEQMNPYISLENLRTLPVYVAGVALQTAIEGILRRSQVISRKGMDSLTRAENLLVSTLGFANWTPPEPLTYSARASSTFAAERLDAQYFMPAKLQVRRSLAASPGQLLSDRVDSIRDQWLPERAEPGTLVRNYDVTDALVPLLDTEKEPSAAEDIGSMKKVLKDGDLAISRLRAYLKEIAVVRIGDDIPSVGSSEFIVLRPRGNSISPETLMVFLRSAPVQTILKWCQDGSQHPRFSESDLLAIPVPDVLAVASPAITGIVLDGFAARRRAAALLDAAKRAVEIAIEQDEAAALRFLDAAEA